MKELRNYQINVNIRKTEFDKLAKMLAEENEPSRSWFVRRLINAEYERRYPTDVETREKESEEAK